MLLAPSAFFIIGFFIWILRERDVKQIEKNDFPMSAHTAEKGAH
jgi:Na+-transporting NADH:ubiquinone oxidoreductase subunit D